jgi:hypothetical protein
LFSAWPGSTNAPSWLLALSREIQAACRDAGTQWLVVACLVCYFITFLVLGRRVLPQETTEGTKEKQSGGSQKSEVRGPFSFFAPFVHFCGQNTEVWLVAFVVLVLVRYAFDYANAAKSLQVVVLFTGIVIGKGIALWAAWARSRGTKVEGREPEKVGRASPLPAGPDSSSQAVRGNSALNSQLYPSRPTPHESRTTLYLSMSPELVSCCRGSIKA